MTGKSANKKAVEMSFEQAAELFATAVAAKSTERLEEVIKAAELNEQINAFEKKFPKIDLQLSSEEIEILRNHFTGAELDAQSLSTPLEKLLLSIIWKNGDWKLIKNVLCGLQEPVSECASENKEAEITSALIMTQFGRSLRKDASLEPIVDQHTLRAYCRFGLDRSDKKRNDWLKALNRNDVLVKDSCLVNSYRKWFKEIITGVSEKKTEFAYLLDKILFIIGKAVKGKELKTVVHQNNTAAEDIG